MWILAHDATHTVTLSPEPYPSHGAEALADTDPDRVVVGMAPRLRGLMEVGAHTGTLGMAHCLADALEVTVRDPGGAVLFSARLALLCAAGLHGIVYGPWMQTATAWVDYGWRDHAATIEWELTVRYDRKGPAAAWEGGPAGRFLDSAGAPVPLNLRKKNRHRIGLGSTVRLAGVHAPVARWEFAGGRWRALLGAAPPWGAGDTVMLFGGPDAASLRPATVAAMDGALVAELDGAQGWGLEAGPAAGNLARVWRVEAIHGIGVESGDVELDAEAPAGALEAVVPSPRIGVVWAGRALKPGIWAEEGADKRDAVWNLDFEMDTPTAAVVKAHLFDLATDDPNEPFRPAFFNLFPAVAEQPDTVVFARPAADFAQSFRGRGADVNPITLSLEEA